MNAYILKEKEAFAKDFGPISEDGIINHPFNKFGLFPWYLAYWYINGFQDEHEGTVEDIGYHAMFRIDDKTKEEYSPDIPAEVLGYILEKDDAGFVHYESYETEETLKQARESVKEKYEEFHTCDRCGHLNLRNGDGCKSNETANEPCTCQDCGDNPED